MRQSDFEDYVRARSAALGRLAYLLVGDVHEAQDVLQTVLARLAFRWEHVQQAHDVDAYVRTALANASASWWRRHRRRPDTPHAVLPDLGVLDADSSQRGELMQMLRELPPRQRAVIVLRYYEEHSEAEVAAILGCSVGTVKSQASKARATLKASWAQRHLSPKNEMESSHDGS